MFTVNISHNEASKFAKYLSQFMELNCAPELLSLGIYPNAKEITESMAAFNAYKHYVKFKVDKTPCPRRTAIYCVADGSTPKTGAMFAFRTRCETYSIDPLMRAEYLRYTINGFDTQTEVLKHVTVFNQQVRPAIKRLTCFKQKIEEYEPTWKPDNTIIVGVHSHVSLDKIIRRLQPTGRLFAIMMPCCVDIVKAEYKKYITQDYADQWLLSPKNRVIVLDIQ